MSEFVSRIEDVFQISNRGCVVVPGIFRSSTLQIKAGDRLRIVRPDGSEVLTTVRGLEMSNPPDKRCIPILFSPEVTKSQLPIDSELWTVSKKGELM